MCSQVGSFKVKSSSKKEDHSFQIDELTTLNRIIIHSRNAMEDRV